MKKHFAVLLVLILVLTAGCGAGTGNVGGVSNAENNEAGLSEEQAALLENVGISLEEFSGLSAEEQQAILDELGIAAGGQEQKPEDETTKAPEKKPTIEDVAAGGKYMVRIGDGRLNNYYLYYENGQLVKVEISFQKNTDEEPETYLFEGDTLPDFWYYDKTLAELIDYFDEQDYGYTHSIYSMN